MDRREMLKGAAIPVFSAGVGWTAVFVPDPKPYDPVAVLEAMVAGERKFGIECDGGRYLVWLFDEPHWRDHRSPFFPDFPSAVRWLHEQAAAADPSFAEAWPVPAEVKQDG